MINSGSGSLVNHIYCYVDTSFSRKNKQPGMEPCIWFGLRSYSGRAWGCHVMLDSGAVVRNLPLHALATREDASPWTLKQAQHIDCYGTEFSVLQYNYLEGLEARTRCDTNEFLGQYLFSVCPLNDGFSAEPEQSKEFMFISLRNGRITAQPTYRVLYIDKSFTEFSGWPTDIKRQTEVWACEREKD